MAKTKITDQSLDAEGTTPPVTAKKNVRVGGAAFADSAFVSNKTIPIHRWVPWIAGFASEFVQEALRSHLPEHGTVLDPFSGVGTTLVEAYLTGHDVIGFEINPYAALACNAKLAAHRVDTTRLFEEINRFQTFCKDAEANGYVPRTTPPGGFKTRAAFYSPAVLNKVLIVQDFVESINEGPLKNIFRLAFASTMVAYSNYSYEPSLAQRISTGKQLITDFAVAETVVAKLNEMAEDVVWVNDTARSFKRGTKAQIFNDSFFRHDNYIVPGSVDLIITSPPYLNNYHYNRNTRPQLYWLGYMNNPQSFKELEHANFGKYWQTVRESSPMMLDFMLDGSDIAETLETLRGVGIEKGIYGGGGWANYAVTYFKDCRRLCYSLMQVLKPGGIALIVIGNSILHGVMIQTDEYFAEIANSVGLEIIGRRILRINRQGNSIIKSDVRAAKADDKHHLHESVIELRRRQR